MGIGPTSLYNSFGARRALCIKALERYVDCSARARLARVESSLPPKQAVRTLIEDVVERSLTDRTRGGCLLINSALEIAPHDPEVGAEIAKRLGEIEGFFRRSISAAQSSGTIPRKLNTSDFARLLLGVLLGIRVLARSKPERTLLEGVARPALSLLNLPARCSIPNGRLLISAIRVPAQRRAPP